MIACSLSIIIIIINTQRVLLKLFSVTTPDEHTILVMLRRLCYGKAISHFPDMSFCGVVSPDLLVTQLHGELKRVLAADTGVHFTGLHQAASYCWRNALLDGKTCKKLRALDIVNSYMKQISVIRCQQFACQVMSQLEEANKKGHITPGPVTEFLAPVPSPVGEFFAPVSAVVSVADYMAPPAVHAAPAPVVEPVAPSPVTENETSMMQFPQAQADHGSQTFESLGPAPVDQIDEFPVTQEEMQLGPPLPDDTEPSMFETTTVGEEPSMFETTTVGEEPPVLELGPPLPDDTEPSMFETTTVGEEPSMFETTTVGEEPSMFETTTVGEEPPLVEWRPPLPDDTEPSMFETTTVGEEPSMFETTTVGEEPPLVEWRPPLPDDTEPSMFVKTTVGVEPPLVELRPPLPDDTVPSMFVKTTVGEVPPVVELGPPLPDDTEPSMFVKTTVSEAPPVVEVGPPLPDVSEPSMIVQTPVVEAHPLVECVTPAPESALPMKAPTGDCATPAKTRRRLKRKARKAESDDDAWMEEAKRDADMDRVRLTEAFHQNIDRLRCPGGHSMMLSVAGPGRLLCSSPISCRVYEGVAYATCTEGDFVACEACLMRYLQEALQPGARASWLGYSTRSAGAAVARLTSWLGYSTRSAGAVHVVSL